MRKTAGIMVMAAALSISVPGTAMAAWNQSDGGWWYQYEDGTYASSGMREVEGNIYFFSSDGYMQTGWQSSNGHWYYFDGNGVLAEGWRQLGDKWYYLNPGRGGVMQTGWMDLGGNRYFFDANGVMQTGMFDPGDENAGSKYMYMADESGALIRNQTIQGSGRTKIKCDAYGHITFRNAKTEEDAKRYGTDLWQPLYSQSQLDEEADNSQNQLKVIQNDLWDSYKSYVKKAKKADREDALAEWKEEVRDELEAYMSSSEIEAFIQKVIAD